MKELDIIDFGEKVNRVRKYMQANGYGAVILTRRDNVSWLTGGGDFKIARDTETAFGVFLITEETVFLIAQSMDAGWIADHQTKSLDVERITLDWYQQSREQKAVELAGTMKIAADAPVPNTEYRLWDIYWLHYPLTENEVNKYKRIAKKCDEMVFELANRVKPGMTEQEIAAEVLCDYTKQGMLMKVLLVGTDANISKYRHPSPSDNKLEKLLLLHPAASMEGLHVNLTRMVYFGDTLPKELEKKYELLNLLEAQSMAMTRPGEKFNTLFDERKRLLDEAGMPDEWMRHYPGAVTGYVLGSAQPFVDDEIIRQGMSAEYFITVEGAKVEEVCISGVNGAELISAGHAWSTKAYTYSGCTYHLPTILMR